MDNGLRFGGGHPFVGKREVLSYEVMFTRVFCQLRSYLGRFLEGGSLAVYFAISDFIRTMFTKG